jgi:hypothetical protein
MNLRLLTNVRIGRKSAGFHQAQRILQPNRARLDMKSMIRRAASAPNSDSVALWRVGDNRHISAVLW